jgi:DNA polymerase-3 subunit gamma/tau
LMHERAGGSPDADDRAKAFAQQFDLPVLGHLARILSETDHKIRHSPYAQLPLEIALVEAIVGSASSSPAMVAPAAGPSGPSPKTERNQPDDNDLLSAPPSTALRDRVRGGARGGHLQVVPSQTDTAPDMSRQTPSPSPVVRSIQETPAPAANNGDVTVQQIAELWPRIRNDVKAVNRRIEALLASIDPISIAGDQITLVAAYDFHRKRMNEDEARRVVEDAISRLVGRTITIFCIMRGDEPPARPTAIPTGPRALSHSSSELEELPLSPRTSEIEPISDSTSDTSDADQQRLQAAKNIFDAEEIKP